VKHTFFQKSKKEQDRIQLLISIGASLVVLLTVLVSYYSGIYPLAVVSAAIVLSVIAPFFSTPALKEEGKIIYYSPLLLAEREKEGTLILHGGTLFDYLFTIDRKLSGPQRTRLIIISYLEGLIDLIDHYQAQQNSRVRVKGTSYILNWKTAQKLGFTVAKAGISQKLLFVYNYVNLVLVKSMAKASLSFPDLKEIITLEADVASLIHRKHYILQLHSKLKDSRYRQTGVDWQEHPGHARDESKKGPIHRGGIAGDEPYAR
jgi:hypothetical protein